MKQDFSAAVRSLRYRTFDASTHPVFSILLPTWNNLPFLRLALESLRKNSKHTHQVVVHVNEGGDGTPAWLESERVDFTWTQRNVGICFGVNAARSLARADYLVYMNDDMYACPGWDAHLLDEIHAIGHEFFFLSATMIEPRFTGNACAIAPQDFGRSPEDFREAELLAAFAGLPMDDYTGTTWPPCVVHRRLWDLVGGQSIEFSPGMYQDPDFAMKLWHAGVRCFKGVGRSRVYHFMGKSTGRVERNDGRGQFMRKWGVSASRFVTGTLRRGEPFTGPLPERPLRPSVITRLRGLWS
jgi:glycosyltransferase involved in cell wall biosynthesis